MNSPRRWLAQRVGLKTAIAVFCLAFIGAVWTAVILQAQAERARTIAEAVRQNANLARVFEEHAVRTIKGIDAGALFIAREYERLGTRIELDKFAEDGYIDGTLIDNIFVIDERGNLALSSNASVAINLADREYFKVHVPRDSGKLFINKPLLGRASGKWTIHMSRRINLPDGSFGGIVSMGVDPGYFANFYRQTDLGKLGLVNLAGLDGISRTRLLGQVADFGEDLSKADLFREQAKSAIGNFLGTSGSEGVLRYVSFRTIPGYPLVISVGASKDEVLAKFRETRRHDYLAALLFTAVIASFGALLIAALARQKRAAAALAASEAQFRATFDLAAVGIAHIAADSFHILLANRRFCDMLGFARDELIGTDSRRLTPPGEMPAREAERARLLAGEIESSSSERCLLRKDGSTLWVNRSLSVVRDPAGRPIYYISVIEDIAKRKQLQQDLQRLAHHDSLTGLPNRALFYDRLKHALDQARRRKWIIGVMFVDLDHFKAVNDTLGHGAGDQLLQQVAERLAHCVRADDTIGRLGGDEFAVILSELRHDEDAGLVARKIIDALARPFQIDGNEILVTGSIGIACCPPHSADADTLVRNADTAMYEAKQTGKNKFRFYGAAKESAESLVPA